MYHEASGAGAAGHFSTVTRHSVFACLVFLPLPPQAPAAAAATPSKATTRAPLSMLSGRPSSSAAGGTVAGMKGRSLADVKASAAAASRQTSSGGGGGARQPSRPTAPLRAGPGPDPRALGSGRPFDRPPPLSLAAGRDERPGPLGFGPGASPGSGPGPYGPGFGPEPWDARRGPPPFTLPPPGMRQMAPPAAAFDGRGGGPPPFGPPSVIEEMRQRSMAGAGENSASRRAVPRALRGCWSRGPRPP